MRILYAEDEPQLSAAVAEILKMEGYEVDLAEDGAAAWELLAAGYYDAVILDIMMPKRSGTEVLAAMREAGNYTPVLMLTAKAGTDDRVEGLSIGADDYLGKPFVMRELLARLNSLIRRSVTYRAVLLMCGNISLNCETGEMTSDRGSLRLSGMESALLAMFLKRPHYPFSTREIDETLWDGKEGASGVHLYLSYLRNKLRQIHATVEITGQDSGWRLEEAGAL